ncbi:MAG TPA: hypothetical protein DIT86_01590 [Hyphomonas sp.]|nr:hypothetical protein [Hyphomonas sp.]
MRFPRVRSIHKYVSLSFLALWALQAASGLAISFRADIDDFFLGQKSVQTETAALAKTIETLQSEGDEISSIWISGGRDGQYDVYLDRDGESRTVRIDGSGARIRDRSDANRFSDGAIFETLTQFHKSLMLGSTGYLFLTISGLLLISNISLGLVAGWSQRKRLRAFTKASSVPAAAALSGWHWRVGFWGAIPALCVILAGTALTQSDLLANGLSVEQKTPESQKPAPTHIVDLGTAMDVALGEYPGSSLVAINLPSENRQWYKFRLKAPGEMPRLYGATRVFVGLDGTVLLDHDAANSAPEERVIESLYPLHTGQIGGLFGRLINAAAGIWLLFMIALGVQLWLARRRGQGAMKSPPGGE